MERTESLILRGLIYDDQYARRVLPYIDPTYFIDRTERILFNNVKAFIDKYNTLPTNEMLIIDLTNADGVEQDTLDECNTYLNVLEDEKETKPNSDWLIETTETWCQEKAVHNAVIDVIGILEGKDKTKRPKTVIPKLLQDALAVSFDPHVGHDYFEDADSRFEFYHRVDTRIPFHLDYLNKITKNGVPNKTLNICLAGTNVGKSLFLCDLAANYLMKSKNVLYITLEMAEERIAERIDANLMDRPVDELPFMSKEGYQKQITRINERTKGKLIIKEYPTAQAHVHHFRHLLNELWLKKNFKPDAIFIDYLNICASSRVKSSSGGLYEVVKAIAEELRGLAVEFNVPIWSATQLNREGFSSNDPDLTNTSESFGLPATADFMFALINIEKLYAMNQLLCKVLKNRYGDIHMRNKENGKIMSKFAIGIDRSKQKLYNVEEAAQDNITQDYGHNKGRKAQPKPVEEKAQLLAPPQSIFDDEAEEPKFDIDDPNPGHEKSGPELEADPPTSERRLSKGRMSSYEASKQRKKFDLNT